MPTTNKNEPAELQLDGLNADLGRDTAMTNLPDAADNRTSHEKLDALARDIAELADILAALTGNVAAVEAYLTHSGPWDLAALREAVGR